MRGMRLFGLWVLVALLGYAEPAYCADGNAGVECGACEDVENTSVTSGNDKVGNVVRADGRKAWDTRFGVRGAFRLNFIGEMSFGGDDDYDDYDDVIGYGGGVGCAFRATHFTHWFVETELSISYDQSPVRVKTMTAPEKGYLLDEGRFRRLSLSLPVCAGYIFELDNSLGIGVMAGVEGSWSVWGDIYNKRSGHSCGFYSGDANWKVCNLMALFGVTFELDEFSVAPRAGIGLINMARKNCFPTRVMNESYMAVTFSYWFK